MIITIKSGEFAGQRMIDLVALAKGLIEPEDLRNGSGLVAQQASKLITMLFADPFLAKITTERMRRLTKQIDVLDIMRRQLVRVPQGKEPPDDQTVDAAEFGSNLKALPVQLFPTLTLEFLRDNKDNPNLVTEVEKGFNTRLGNDLVDLGFNGVADDEAGATRAEKFIRLNKGWVQLVKDAQHSPKVDIDAPTDGWISCLQNVVDAADENFAPNSVLIMNHRDAGQYARELNAPITGTAMHAESPTRQFEGIPIEAHPLMPRGHVMFTPLKNLVFGVHTTILRDRAYKSRKRALEYTFDMDVDYEVAVKQAAVLGYNIP